MANSILSLLSGAKNLNSVTLSFRIPYFTQWGQQILVCGSEPVLGSWNVKKGLLLSPSHQNDELMWCGSISVPTEFACEYSYYVVDDARNILRWEIGNKRKLLLPGGIQSGQGVEVHDLWKTGSESLPFTSAFKNVIFRRSLSSGNDESARVTETQLEQKDCSTNFIIVQFSICCPNVEGASIHVIGSPVELGQWKARGGLKLIYAGDSVWQGSCVMQKDDFPITYRYAKCDQTGKLSVELGPNRETTVDFSRSQPNYIVRSDGLMRETPWRGAGVAIPMFSVRSEEDLGVGEFLDLKLVVDWAVQSGFHLVQLLPINDTSVHQMWWDSYPYSSLSVFALHPLYLRVQTLSDNIPEDMKEEIKQASLKLDGKSLSFSAKKLLMDGFPLAKNLLPAKPSLLYTVSGPTSMQVVDYEATMAMKLSIAKKIYNLEKGMLLKSTSFQKFFIENQDWLEPYAAFCFLRDFFETSERSQWGSYANFSKTKLKKLVSKDSLQYDVICFHYYIQFHLHMQLSEAADYARKNGIVLKGDLPIGVDRNSVDTWVYPNLFRMNTSTGAPPDYFDKNGQNWGFPTYNWEEMSKDNYAWWCARLTKMAKYFTAYRIDHILGFFRIWELQDHAMTGLCGKFRPSIPLSQEELEMEGIWDFDCLLRPCIKREILEEKFGASWTMVASIFMKGPQKDLYEFKEDCNTERKIASKLKSCIEKSMLFESEEKLRHHLFYLIKDVVLIRDPEDSRKYYPRFNMEDTLCYKGLDQHSKNVLKRLYYDYYFHRQDNLWRQNALKTLPVLLNSSDMLACGEDLGLIPSCVHPVMQELGLIGLRIQRMPNEPDLEFGIPSQYSYMTVCAPSCHDCSTLRAWWEEDEERRRRFSQTFLGSNTLPPDQCIPEIAYFILRQHIEAPSMWAIFPLQDLLALKEEYAARPAAEETINDPTNPKHYWRYRVHVTMETLLKDKELITVIKDLVQGSGRSCPEKQAIANGLGKVGQSEETVAIS